MRFKSLAATSRLLHRTIDYSYDGLSRLLEADYNNGTVHTYGFDVAGNLTNLNGTTRTYNAANQMTNDGTNTITFDDNGNMTSDGVQQYTWDRANRLLSHAGTSYAYDGNSNRISQTVSSIVTEYLVDTQPALSKVLRQSDSTNTTHFVHAPRGIHAQYDGTDWMYTAQDALGSVRTAFDDTATIQQRVNYNPVGVPDSSYDGFAFTGEQRDSNELQYHRARYYDPVLGVWASLDPLEGLHNRPMSLNGYSWVEGNPTNWVDYDGFQRANPCSDLSCRRTHVCDTWRDSHLGSIGKSPREQCRLVHEADLSSDFRAQQRLRGWFTSIAYLAPVIGLGGSMFTESMLHYRDGGNSIMDLDSSWYLNTNYIQKHKATLYDWYIKNHCVEPTCAGVEGTVCAKIFVSTGEQEDDQHVQSDVRFTLGRHYLRGCFRQEGFTIRADFRIIDCFDFSCDACIPPSATFGCVPQSWWSRMADAGQFSGAFKQQIGWFERTPFISLTQLSLARAQGAYLQNSLGNCTDNDLHCPRLSMITSEEFSNTDLPCSTSKCS